MDVQLLKNVITKLKTTEIFDVLSRWSFLSTEDVEKLESNRKSRQTKRVVANDLAEFCRVCCVPFISFICVYNLKIGLT